MLYFLNAVGSMISNMTFLCVMNVIKVLRTSLHFSEVLCISLHFSVFLYISLPFSKFVWISLHLSEFLCISLHFSAFLCISLHFSAILCISHIYLFYWLDCKTWKPAWSWSELDVWIPGIWFQRRRRLIVARPWGTWADCNVHMIFDDMRRIGKNVKMLSLL